MKIRKAKLRDKVRRARDKNWKPIRDVLRLGFIFIIAVSVFVGLVVFILRMLN